MSNIFWSCEDLFLFKVEELTWLCFSVLRQYQDFLEDLEEDEALRKNVNIYRGEQLGRDFTLSLSTSE